MAQRALDQAAAAGRVLRQLAQEVEASPPFVCRPFEVNIGLATAVQCEARGWRDLAAALLERSLQQDAGHHYGNFYQPADQPPRTALAYLAWAHAGNELAKPSSDWAAIARRMEKLLAVEPKLKTAWNEALLRRLHAALKPSRAKLGSPVKRQLFLPLSDN